MPERDARREGASEGVGGGASAGGAEVGGDGAQAERAPRGL